MSPDIERFVDDLIQGYMRSGLPRSVAQIIVFLTVCEPAQQTASGIQKQLGLSAGSVSSALGMFVGAGLVSRSKPVGSKYYVYELKSEAWEQSIAHRITAVQQLATIAHRGSTLIPDNRRLSAMYDMYEYFGNEFRDLLARYHSQR